MWVRRPSHSVTPNKLYMLLEILPCTTNAMLWFYLLQVWSKSFPNWVDISKSYYIVIFWIVTFRSRTCKVLQAQLFMEPACFNHSQGPSSIDSSYLYHIQILGCWKWIEFGGGTAHLDYTSWMRNGELKEVKWRMVGGIQAEAGLPGLLNILRLEFRTSVSVQLTVCCASWIGCMKQ